MTLTTADLNQFSGTNHYYRHWAMRLVYTDGVKYVANDADAYWLLDAISSYQTRTFLKDPMLQEFQVWKLTVNANDTVTLVCERDTNDVVLSQEIAYTDFPLDEIKFYLVEGVLMLPSEY